MKIVCHRAVGLILDADRHVADRVVHEEERGSARRRSPGAGRPAATEVEARPGSRKPTWLKFERFEFEIVSSLAAFLWMKPCWGRHPLARSGKTPASGRWGRSAANECRVRSLSMMPPPCISIRVMYLMSALSIRLPSRGSRRL